MVDLPHPDSPTYIISPCEEKQCLLEPKTYQCNALPGRDRQIKIIDDSNVTGRIAERHAFNSYVAFHVLQFSSACIGLFGLKVNKPSLLLVHTRREGRRQYHGWDRVHHILYQVESGFTFEEFWEYAQRL